jgi:hypothetical protein
MLWAPPMRTSIVMIAVVSGFALVPSAAIANDDNYACSLTPTAGFVKKEFGLPHAAKQKDFEGGTNDQLGAFSSNCVVIAWVTKPKPAGHPFGKPPKFATRPGFAKLSVTTTIEDTEEAGGSWDPEKLRIKNLAVYDLLIETWGGRQVGYPIFGQSDMHGIEWGLLADNAAGLWEHEEHGFLSITVSSHGKAGQHLADLAQHIVPKFKP